MSRLPRILLISNEAPHTGAAGAIVFHRLFRDYPPERLLVVTNAPPPAGAAILTCRYAPLRLAVDRLNRTRFWPLRSILRVLGGASLIDLRRVDAVLEGFVPDVVVTLMQDSWFYELAANYALSRDLPLVLFSHDLAHGFEPVPTRLQKLQLRRDKAVYRQASVRLCVSPGMVDFYARTFGARGEVLLPPRSDDTPSQSPESCSQLKHPGRLTLGYAGGLHYGYGEQLLRMLPVLRETGTIIEMFGPEPGGSVIPLRDATDVLRFNGYASTPEEAWRGLLDKCDAVLQPYLNPAGKHELQYRTHFPSKLGDCLSLGLPLIITGPAYASGVAWCLQHSGCAVAVTDPAPSALAAALVRLRDDVALRVSLAARAQQAAQEFSGDQLRAQMNAGLHAAWGKSP